MDWSEEHFASAICSQGNVGPPSQPKRALLNLMSANMESPATHSKAQTTKKYSTQISQDAPDPTLYHSLQIHKQLHVHRHSTCTMLWKWSKPLHTYMYKHVCMHTYYTYCRLINFNRSVFVYVQVSLNAVSCTVQLAGSPFT